MIDPNSPDTNPVDENPAPAPVPAAAPTAPQPVASAPDPSATPSTPSTPPAEDPNSVPPMMDALGRVGVATGLYSSAVAKNKLQYKSKFGFVNEQSEASLDAPPPVDSDKPVDPYANQRIKPDPVAAQFNRETQPDLFRIGNLSIGNENEYSHLDREYRDSQREQAFAVVRGLLRDEEQAVKDHAEGKIDDAKLKEIRDANVFGTPYIREDGTLGDAKIYGRDGKAELSPESIDPDYVFEQLGRLPEQSADLERRWYARKGYAHPDDRNQLGVTYDKWDNMSPEEREKHQAWRESKGLPRATREDFAQQNNDLKRAQLELIERVGPANPQREEAYEAQRLANSEEALDLFDQRVELAREYGGYEKGDPRAAEFAKQAFSDRHLATLIEMDDQRQMAMYSGVGYAGQHADDDMGEYTLGYWDRWQMAAWDAARATPDAIASVGAALITGPGRFLGLLSEDQLEFFDQYTNEVAEHSMHMQSRHALVASTGMKAYRVTDSFSPATNKFLTETAYKSADIFGMLSFDIATSLFTAKVPGLTSAATASIKTGIARSAGKSTVFAVNKKSLVTTVARPVTATSAAAKTGVENLTGSFLRSHIRNRELTEKIFQFAKKPPSHGKIHSTTYRGMRAEEAGGDLAGAIRTTTTRGLAHDAAGIVRRVGAREITHGPNTFLTRVYGETYASSLARQEMRAAEEGREVSALDRFYAMGDAAASTTIAHLIGKNIPKFNGRLPSKGKGSEGFASILGKKGFTPKTIQSAMARASARALIAPTRSGADFAAFELLMDMYALTDQDDRSDVLNRYINNTGDQMKNLFGSFLVGIPLGAMKLPAEIRAPFRKFREFKDGVAAFNYLNSLPTAERTAIYDRLTDSHFQGMQARVKAESDYVNGEGKPLAEFNREQLAELLFYGDRELPSHLQATTEGVPGHVKSRYSEPATTASDKGRTRETLSNAEGQIEISQNMARLELIRRGESIDAVQFRNGSVDTLFMGRSEATARRNTVASELSTRIRPTSPKPKDVRETKNLIENLPTIGKHPLIMPPAEAMAELTKDQQRKVAEAAADIAYADALASGNSSQAKALRDLGAKGGKGKKSRVKPSKVNHPLLRPHLRKAIVSTGMREVIESGRSNTPASKSALTMVDGLVRRNMPLARWVASQSVAGKNTPQNPAISRRQMEALTGGKIPPEQNTKQARYKLGELITAHARKEISPVHPNKIRSKFLPSSRGELAKPGEIAPPIPLETATSPAQVVRSTSSPPLMTKEAFEAKNKAAESRGSKPLEPLPESDKTPASMERNRPIDTEIERLSQRDQVESPLREPVPVRTPDGNPVFGIPTKERLKLALERLRDEFGVTNVELDFSEGFHSLLGNSVHAVGRASGFSVVVVHGERKGNLRDVMDMGNGIMVVHSSVQPQVARGQITSRGATLKWIASRQGKSNPINWLEHHMAGAGIGSRRMAAVYKAVTGREVTTEQFRDGILLAAKESPAKAAALWEMLFPVLSESERHGIINKYPKEMAEWYGLQLVAIEGAGFIAHRKGNSLFGGPKETAMILGIANGAVEPKGVKGKTKSRIIKGIDKAVTTRKEHFSTPQDIVAEYRANRDALLEGFSESGTKPEKAPTEAKEKEADKNAIPLEPAPKEPVFDRAEAERKVAEEAAKPEPLDLFRDGVFDVAAARGIEAEFPGLFQRANEAMASAEPGQPVQFEHAGFMFTVVPRKVKGQGKPAVGLISAERMEHTGRAERLMDAEMREAADKQVQLMASGSNRERVTERELLESDKPPGDKPPKDPTTEGSPEPGGTPPEPGSVAVNVSEGPQPERMQGIKAKVVKALQYVMDPASYADIVSIEPFRRLLNKAFEAEQVINSERDAVMEKVGRIFRDLEKDKSSTLVNGKDGSGLVRILEGAEIAPTMEALNAHPLTAKLSAKEKEYVIAIKEIYESQRQDQRAVMQETIRVGYESVGKAENLVSRANEANLSVEARVKNVGRKKMFTVNDGTERITFDRQGFIDFMVNKQVPENYGYKYSYFPHMFFGQYRATITATGKNGEAIAVEKLGIGERGSIQGERQQIMLDVQAKMKEIRERLGEEVSFQAEIRDGQTHIPKEAIYLPDGARRRLVQTLQNETKSSRHEINQALAGKISSKPVKTSFLSSMLEREGADGYSMNAQRVLELSINSHYRNKLSKRLQKESRPELEALAEMGVPEYIQNYARNTLEHILYGSKSERNAPARGLERKIAKTGSVLRSIQFYRQLFRPAQHVINSTQVTQAAALVGFKEFGKAVYEYNFDPKAKKFIEEHGFFDLNGRFDAGKFGDSLSPTSAGFLHKVHGTVNKVTGKVWNANSEARNQNLAFWVLARHAMKNLNKTEAEAATYGRLYGSLRTQYRFSRANDPVFLRGDVGRTLGQFKRFWIQTAGLMATLTKHAATGKEIEGIGRAGPIIRFMLLNSVFGGARGSLIGAGAILTGGAGLAMYSMIRQSFEGDEYVGSLPTNPFKSEAAAYKWLVDNAGQDAAEQIMFGVMSGAGVDASGSFNLLNFGPGGLLDYMAGPTLGMFTRTYSDLQLRDSQARGMPVRVLESLVNGGAATRGLKAAIEYGIYSHKFNMPHEDGSAYMNTPLGILSANEYRQGTSEMVRYRNTRDMLAAMAGFRSVDGTAEYLAAANEDAWIQHWNDARNRVAAIYNRDPNAGRAAMESWNEQYGAYLPMGYGDISEMRETTRDRSERSRTERNQDRRGDDVRRGIKDKERLGL